MNTSPVTVVKFNLTKEEEKNYREIAQELCKIRNELGKYPSMANKSDKIIAIEKMLLDIADTKELRSH